jgi:hypothetical protein
VISTTIADSPLFWLAIIGGLAALYLLPVVIGAIRHVEGLGWIIVVNLAPYGLAGRAADGLHDAPPRTPTTVLLGKIRTLTRTAASATSQHPSWDLRRREDLSG